NSFQQTAHIPAYAKNLIDEINVLDSPAYQRIDLLQQSFYAALAEPVAKQCLIAKRASPRTTTRKLQLRANSVLLGKYMVPMPMSFDVVVMKIKRRKGGHIGHAQPWIDVNAVFSFEAASCYLVPGLVRQLSARLIRPAP